MPTNLESAASQVMGVVKAGKAKLQGLTGVFRTLMEEHGKVSALLMRVKMSSDPELRRSLFPAIREELLAHEKGEVTVLYPVFGEHPETARIAAEHDTEARQLHDVIERLHTLDVEDPTWGALFDQLVKLVQHHVHEEESEYFPLGERLFDDQAELLDTKFKQTKADAIAGIV